MVVQSCLPPNKLVVLEKLIDLLPHALEIISSFFSITVQEMIDCPYETRSDSYYFVEDKLIMHNKADYAYNGGT